MLESDGAGTMINPKEEPKPIIDLSCKDERDKFLRMIEEANNKISLANRRITLARHDINVAQSSVLKMERSLTTYGKSDEEDE